MSKQIFFSTSAFASMILKRRANKEPTNICVCGIPGSGKSLTTWIILRKIKSFDYASMLVYSRKDTIKRLVKYTKSICWNDELIEAGFKRDFQKADQNVLVKLLNTARYKQNIFVGSLPNFFSLDPEIRDRFDIMLFKISKNLCAVHMPIEGIIYNKDRWDATENAKKEREYMSSAKKEISSIMKLHEKLSTFVCYIIVPTLKPEEIQLYENVKSAKRSLIEKATIDSLEDEIEEKTLEEDLAELILDKKLTEDLLKKKCKENKRDEVEVRVKLKNYLSKMGLPTLKKYFEDQKKIEKTKPKETSEEIKDIIDV